MYAQLLLLLLLLLLLPAFSAPPTCKALGNRFRLHTL
jgi:hypothetical protein